MRELELEIIVKKEQAKAELGEVDRAIDSLVSRAVKAGGATDEMNRRFVAMTKGAANLRQEVRGYDKELDRLGTQTVPKASSAVAGLSTVITRFVGPAALGLALKSTLNWADRLQDLSDMSGIASSALAKMEKLARGNGATLDEVARSAVVLQDRVAGGDKSLLRGFERLGIAYDHFKRLEPEAQMVELGRALGQMSSQQERTNVLADVLGSRIGPKLASTLIEIGDGLAGLDGPSQAQIAAAAQIADQWDRLVLTGKGALLDAITDISQTLTGLRSVVPNWVEEANHLTTLGGAYGYVRERVALLALAYSELRASRSSGGGGGGGWGDDAFQVPGAPGMFGPRSGSAPGMGAAEVEAAERRINDQLREQARGRQDALRVAERQARVAEQQAAFEATIASYFSSRYDIGLNMATLPGSLGAFVPGSPFLDASGLPETMHYGTPGVASGGNIAQQVAAGGGGGGSWLSRIQRRWLSSAFSDRNFAPTMLQYGANVVDLFQSGGAIGRATDRAGRGARIGSGAMAGAQIGMIGGPWGAAGGALVGALVGAFRQPAFEDVMKRVGSNFGRAISEETARSIASLAKGQFRGDRQAAEIFSLSSIVGEGGLNAGNAGQMLARFRDAFSMREMGKFTQGQLSQVLDENFGTFAAYFDNLGGLADKRFTEIIELQRRFGVESAAVTAYVAQQSERSIGGLEQYLSSTTVKSQEAASGLVGAAVKLFDELRKGPDGVRGAAERVMPLVMALEEQLTAAGFAGNDAFTSILTIVQAMQVEGVEPAARAVDGLTETLIGMSNSALMNEDIFRGLSRAIVDEVNASREALVAQGQDGNLTYQIHQRGLQTIWEMQQRYNYTVDEATQTLLDQAAAQGQVGEAFMSASDQMVSVLKDVRDILSDVRDAMFGVGDAAEDAARQTEEAWRGIDLPDLPDSYDRQGDGSYAAGGGYVTARGIRYLAHGGVIRPFYFARGSDTVPAMLTPGEGVLSRRGMAALGALNHGQAVGGVTINTLTIHASSEADGRAAARGFVDEMRRRGIKQRAA
jgi:hypothetical protein